MHQSNTAGAARPGHTGLRALSAAVLLSSHWVVAGAAPILSGTPPSSVIAAHYYAFQPSATNGAGKKLTFSIANKPAWAQFDSGTGRLYGTPLPQSNVGTFANISIAASDGASRIALPSFSITVLPLPNTPPVISGTPATSVSAGHSYSYEPVVHDPNGLRVTFGIWNKPSWANFNSSTGALVGNPTTANVGSYPNIVITAYDGWMKTQLPAFTIAVRPASAAGGGVTPPPVTPPPVTAPPSGSATLAWTPPTETTGGTVLTNLAGYNIYYGAAPGSLGHKITVANPGLTRYVVGGLSVATWYFQMTAYDTTGLESPPTPVESLTVTQ
jgi:hypothetical protein